MEAEEQFKQLDLSNAFLFSLAFSDPEACALVLQVILQKPVYKVMVQPEKSILYSKEFRSVRLDVYARDSMEAEYDLEMQNEDQGNLPLRSRFYQAEMDAAALKPGEDFKRLRPSYVIFICAFDPFGEGYYRYTFENRQASGGRDAQDLFEHQGDPPGGRAEGADPFFAVPGELHRRVRAEHAGRDRGKAS